MNSNNVNTLDEAICSMESIIKQYKPNSYISREANKLYRLLKKIENDVSTPSIKTNIFDMELKRSCNWFLHCIQSANNTDICDKFKSYVKQHNDIIKQNKKCIHIPSKTIGGPYIFLNGNIKLIAYDILQENHKDLLNFYKITVYDLVKIIDDHEHYMKLCKKCPLCKKVD